jgi:hypothetical protein
VVLPLPRKPVRILPLILINIILLNLKNNY